MSVVVGNCDSTGHVVVHCSTCGRKVFECACTDVKKIATVVLRCPACIVAAKPKPRILLTRTKERRFAQRRVWGRRETDT